MPTPMTLDEAIAHADEVADEGQCATNGQCATDHRQLADWLRELKVRRANDHGATMTPTTVAETELDLEAFLAFVDESVQQCEDNGTDGFREPLADSPKYTLMFRATQTRDPSGVAIDEAFSERFEFDLPDMSNRHLGWYFYADFVPLKVN